MSSKLTFSENVVLHLSPSLSQTICRTDLTALVLVTGLLCSCHRFCFYFILIIQTYKLMARWYHLPYVTHIATLQVGLYRLYIIIVVTGYVRRTKIASSLIDFLTAWLI